MANPDDNRVDDPRFLDLREAWEHVAPEHQTTSDLSACDPMTQKAVAWMAAAWDQALPDSGVRSTPSRGVSSRKRKASVALLAAAFVASLVLIFSRREDPVPSPRDEAESPTLLPAELRPDGSIELRSGSVRLILVFPGSLEVDDSSG